MPPHCDALDGPVVRTTIRALEWREVDSLLTYVPEEGAAKVRGTFAEVCAARVLEEPARVVADRHLFETVVRIHRAGEGAPFEGLKPAGLDPGPIIPLAERALECASADGLSAALAAIIDRLAREKLARALELRSAAPQDVPEARAYVGAMLGLQVWAHQAYLTAISSHHAEVGGAGHTHSE